MAINFVTYFFKLSVDTDKTIAAGEPAVPGVTCSTGYCMDSVQGRCCGRDINVSGVRVSRVPPSISSGPTRNVTGRRSNRRGAIYHRPGGRS